MPVFYSHWSDIPLREWYRRWPNFHPSEIASKGDGSLLVHEDALDALQSARRKLGVLHINSAYRDPRYNALVGGAPMSRHKTGDAFDISLRNQEKKQVLEVCEHVGFRGFGINYNTFVHVDMGRKRRW